uniref:Uncharacterized protein n=1 Tax=Timema poppense TaxID=170557 RepID=A0A7R9DLD1_TIMPO|nr:unnamed protein product [Timema poppensis]
MPNVLKTFYAIRIQAISKRLPLVLCWNSSHLSVKRISASVNTTPVEQQPQFRQKSQLPEID